MTAEVERSEVLLDTNIYFYLLEKPEASLLEKIKATKKVTFHGFEIIRKELAKIPGNKTFAKKKYRRIVLSLYDELVGGYSFNLTPLIEALAKEYAKKYRGSKATSKMRNDFLIVACASFHKMDILVSDDDSTMFSKPARTAYKKVNEINGLRMPNLYHLRDLKKLV